MKPILPTRSRRREIPQTYLVCSKKKLHNQLGLGEQSHKMEWFGIQAQKKQIKFFNAALRSCLIGDGLEEGR